MNSSIIDGTIALLGGLSVLVSAVWIFSTSTSEIFTQQEGTETNDQGNQSTNARKAA